MAGDLLATILAEIDDRLAALRPAFDESEQLLAAMVALGIDSPASASAPLDAPAEEIALPVRRAPARRRPVAARKPLVVRKASRPEPEPVSVPRETATAEVLASPPPPPPPPGSTGGEAEQAILAALEHGSHTVAELAVVTAMPGPSIRDTLRGLTGSGGVVRAKRDGKAAYALPG